MFGLRRCAFPQCRSPAKHSTTMRYAPEEYCTKYSGWKPPLRWKPSGHVNQGSRRRFGLLVLRQLGRPLPIEAMGEIFFPPPEQRG